MTENSKNAGQKSRTTPRQSTSTSARREGEARKNDLVKVVDRIENTIGVLHSRVDEMPDSAFMANSDVLLNIIGSTCVSTRYLLLRARNYYTDSDSLDALQIVLQRISRDVDSIARADDHEVRHPFERLRAIAALAREVDELNAQIELAIVEEDSERSRELRKYISVATHSTRRFEDSTAQVESQLQLLHEVIAREGAKIANLEEEGRDFREFQAQSLRTELVAF